MAQLVPASLQPYMNFLLPALIVALFVAAGYIGRKLFDRYVLALAKKTQFKFDEVILGAIRGPFVLWFLLGGLFVAQDLLTLDPGLSKGLETIISVLLSLSIIIVTVKVATGLITTYGQRVETFRPLMGISQRLVKMFIWFLGAMFILNAAGVSITPLLASFGIAGLAIALALQDTLANFFSGFYITADRPIRVGDYVSIQGENVEGYVLDIGWRSTRIRTLPNWVVVIPNLKLAQSIIINYYLPEPEMAALVNVSVAYGSDLAKVESVTIEVAREIQKEVRGGVPTHEPFIRYNTFGDSGIGFTVILRVKEFVDQYLVTHEFVKRLHARYAKEGFEIPFPQRVVHLKGKSA